MAYLLGPSGRLVVEGAHLRPSALSSQRPPDTQWDGAMRHGDGLNILDRDAFARSSLSPAPRPRQHTACPCHRTLGIFRISLVVGRDTQATTWLACHASGSTELIGVWPITFCENLRARLFYLAHNQSLGANEIRIPPRGVPVAGGSVLSHVPHGLRSHVGVWLVPYPGCPCRGAGAQAWPHPRLSPSLGSSWQGNRLSSLA